MQKIFLYITITLLFITNGLFAQLDPHQFEDIIPFRKGKYWGLVYSDFKEFVAVILMLEFGYYFL